MKTTIIIFGFDPDVARKNGIALIGRADPVPTRRIDYPLPAERISAILTSLAKDVDGGEPGLDVFAPLAGAIAEECFDLSNHPERRQEWQSLAGKPINCKVGDAVVFESGFNPAATVVCVGDGWHLEGNPAKAEKLIADLEAAGDFSSRSKLTDSLLPNTSGRLSSARLSSANPLPAKGDLGYKEAIVKWANQHGCADMPSFWENCSAANLMLDYATLVLDPEDIEGRKKLALTACACAKRAFPIWEMGSPGDTRPKKSLVATEKWTRGETTLDDVKLAAAGAELAVLRVKGATQGKFVSAARSIVKAADTALFDLAGADSTPSAAAWSAIHAANALSNGPRHFEQTMGHLSDLVREHYPELPSPGKPPNFGQVTPAEPPSLETEERRAGEINRGFGVSAPGIT